MSSLFNLSAQYQQLMSQIMETDEISDELMDSIEAINDSLESKVLNYTGMIKEMKAKAKNIEEAMEAMLKRMKSLLNGAAYLETQVKIEMQKCDKKKIENEYHEVSIVINNPRVEVIDKEAIPQEWWRSKQSVELDKAAISNALKSGIKINGVQLVRDSRIAIR